MQIFVRCGEPVGTLPLELSPLDNVGDVKSKLSNRTGLPVDYMRLLYAGRQLSDSTAASAVCSPNATLQLSSRLLGGGGDGGATGAESRSCYLEMYLGKKADKVNPIEQLLAQWTRCHLSGDLLSMPVVADELGFLFNKDAVVNALLHKAMPPAFGHLTSLKHVVDLKLEKNPHKGAVPGSAANIGGLASVPTSSSGNVGPSNDAAFVCPVTGVAFNGRFKAFVDRKTGHVVSEKAMKDAPAVVEELLGRKWSSSELTPINPTGEQLEEMYERVTARLAADREKKAMKKKSKGETKALEAAAAGDATSSGTMINNSAAGGNSSSPELTTSGKRGATPNISEATTGAKAAAGAAAAPGAAPPPNKKTKIGTDVYKSIFTSSKPDMKETYCCRSTGARAFR